MVRHIFRAGAVAALLAVAVGSTAARADGPIVIKFSHVVAPDTPKGAGALKFKDLAETYTNGKVKVEVYPNSTLYKDKEEVEALQLGAVQMLAPSLAKFGPLGVKEFEVFDLPYILPDKAALRRVTDGDVGRGLFAKLEGRGIKGLAYWDNGFKVMTDNKPLRAPADFRGQKMRIQSSKVLEAQFKALGLQPAGENGGWTPCRRWWPSPTCTRRCRPAWWTARRTRRPTPTRPSTTRCRSTSPPPTTATSATP